MHEYLWNTRRVADRFEKSHGLTLSRQQYLIGQGVIDQKEVQLRPGRGRSARGLSENAVLQLLVASEMQKIFREFPIVKEVLAQFRKLSKHALLFSSYQKDSPATVLLRVVYTPGGSEFVVGYDAYRDRDSLKTAKKIETEVKGATALVLINITELAELMK
jgi:hypothetical protein